MHHGLLTLNLIEMKKMKKIPKSSGVRNKIVIQELKRLEKIYTNIMENEVNNESDTSDEYDYADILLYSIHAILAHYGVKKYIND
jgi:hypothetical protein